MNKGGRVIKRGDPRAAAAVPIAGGDRVPAEFWAEDEPVELRPMVDYDRRVWWEAQTRIAGQRVATTAHSANYALQHLETLIALKLRGR